MVLRTPLYTLSVTPSPKSSGSEKKGSVRNPKKVKMLDMKEARTRIRMMIKANLKKVAMHPCLTTGAGSFADFTPS